jgi:hypothetical protein
MKARTAWLALAAMVLCAACRQRQPPVRESTPFSNTILVYADRGRDWVPGSFTYYLAHVDKDGTPGDWLFDGFLFLAITAASGRNFWDGKANASDWDWWLDKMFEKGRQLDALELDARSLEPLVGPVIPKKVIISIPRPPVDADAAGQWAVVKGFVDRSVRRFAEKGHRNIELDGFYWFHEGVDGTNAELVNRLRQDLHARGLRLYWIPYDVGHENRAHLLKWRMKSLSFDGLWLQPNYFWAERNAKYAAQDLDDTAWFAKSMGSEVEIEFDHGVYTTGWKLGRYTHYLMSGDVYGYRNGPLMYYDGYQGYIKSGQSRNPVQRAIYDDLYWFCRKAYLPKPIIYPGVFFEKGGAEDPAGHPQIGLWLERGGTRSRIFLVEPDPNKDYLVILKSTGSGRSGLEVSVDGAWTPLDPVTSTKSGAGATRLERYRLPRAVIQKIWKPKTLLVIELRRTGGGAIEAGWARPDDFVFRYVKGKEPMETEMRLDFSGPPLDQTGESRNREGSQAATLRNAFGETVVGLRAVGTGGRAGLTISDGSSRSKRVAREAAAGNEVIWTRVNGGRDGDIRIQPDPGLEIAELWAFAAGTVFHLRPGSCGDTRVDLHVPGAGLIPDGKWHLAGEFGRNYRTDLAGAGLYITAPDFARSWKLVLLVDAEAGVDLREQGPTAAVTKIGAGTRRRVSVTLKPGEHRLVFTGPVALYDAWLEPG